MAAVLLIGVTPLLVGLSVFVLLVSGQAPVIADRRVGRRGHLFWMYKLRTMWPAGRKHWPTLHFVEYLAEPGARAGKSRCDPRVTSKVAAYCRRHSIDELLQLWHVVRGEMSFVGPRPITSSELSQHYGQDAREVLSVKPGLSGLWQVTGRSRLSYRQRKRLDLHLVRNYSTQLYFAILRRTVWCVVRGESAW
jgi:lipopolysaccharide/colanic/teichoic acid biosynthesis glycosyltransferase